MDLARPAEDMVVVSNLVITTETAQHFRPSTSRPGYIFQDYMTCLTWYSDNHKFIAPLESYGMQKRQQLYLGILLVTTRARVISESLRCCFFLYLLHDIGLPH
jgi:hypothetical protein